MRSINLLLATLLLLALSMLPAGCGGGGGGGGGGGQSTPTLSSIAVTPANASIAAGATQQYTATGTFSDGSTQNLTNLVTWSSSSGAVLIGSATGLVTTSAAGSATITAQSGAITGSTQLTVTGGSSVGANVMAVTVNGSLCSDATSGGYFNKPCVSVTICNPDGSACQTVNDILLDTGSYGLRVFRQAVPGLTLPQANSNQGGSLAECIQFADSSTIWGPVQIASVRLAGEPAITIPIHVIDAGFATPTSCGSPDPDPVTAGYAGILGVGPLAQDCGSNCASSAQNQVYFSCVGSTCTGTAVSLVNQVPNPVSSLPGDRNGILVQLPAVPLGGAPSVNGSLFLGIGTQANNTPAAATVLPTDQLGDFRTLFGGNNSIGFLDTGSNALFFPNATGIPLCSDPNWYCPPTTLSLSGSLIGSGGSPSQAEPFNVGNFDSLFSSSSNNVFSEIGGPSTFGFDWGLPFFLGRSVFIGISGRAATGLGTGPYVAF